MSKEEFDELIDKYLSGRASPEEQRFMDDFFRSQEAEQTLPHYTVSEEMWAAIERGIAQKPGLKIARKPHSSPKSKFVAARLMIAVVLVLIPLAAFLFLPTRISPSHLSWITSECPKGQKSLITLADGSRIFLNSGSTVSYPETFERDKREIVLSGEAYFEIAHDERRPLTVQSGGLLTTVLGTSFNIQAFEGQPARVTVASGSVRVQVEGTTGSSHRVVLVPDQQVVYDAGEALLTRNVTAREVIAWKDQILFFDNNTLEEVASCLERWYNVSIRFDNEDIKNCRINGQYKQVNLQTVLESIGYMYDIEYKFSGQNNVVLYGKGCQ